MYGQMVYTRDLTGVNDSDTRISRDRFHCDSCYLDMAQVDRIRNRAKAFKEWDKIRNRYVRS